MSIMLLLLVLLLLSMLFMNMFVFVFVMFGDDIFEFWRSFWVVDDQFNQFEM